MIGVILITHGGLAEALLMTTKEIVGDIGDIRVLSIDTSDDEDKIRDILSDNIKEMDKGDGVIILTDMFGGTPSNISLSFLSDDKVEVLTGVNLPMLIKAASTKGDMKLVELAEMLKCKGQESIVLASEILKSRE